MVRDLYPLFFEAVGFKGAGTRTMKRSMTAWMKRFANSTVEDRFPCDPSTREIRLLHSLKDGDSSVPRPV